MNLFEEYPKIAIGMVVAAGVGLIAVNGMMKRHNTKLSRMMEEVDGGGRESRPQTERLKKARGLEYRDAEGALKIVEAILAGPEDGDEAAQAKELHARILKDFFHKTINDGKVTEAQGFMDELVATYPESFLVEHVRRGWSNERKKVVRSHVKAGQFPEARAILQELAEERLLFQDSTVLKQYQSAVAESWLQDGERVEEVEVLVEAASVLGQIGQGCPITRVLARSKMPGNDLLNVANKQAGGVDKYRSIPLYHGVLARLNRNGWFGKGKDLDFKQKEALRQQIEYKLANLYAELGAEMESGTTPLITATDLEDLYYQMAGSLRTPALRPFLVRRQIRLQWQRLQEMSKPMEKYPLEALASGKLPADEHNALNSVLRDSGNLARKILRQSASRLWPDVVSDPKFDPWPLLPPNMREEFDALRRKGRTEEDLRRALASRAGGNFVVPLPELQPVQALEAEINARRGLITYAVQPAECTEWMRKALAGNPDPKFRERLIAAASRALESSRGRGQFEAFYELTRFFVGEVGLESLPRDRRDEFRTGLGQAAKSMTGGNAAKGLFLLAIQAEAFPDHAEGKAARSEAMKRAHDLVARRELKKVEPVGLPGSGLDGFSVLSIDNTTQHHLLIFYRGPESFFMACRPNKKVSAILADGSYEVAVLTPSGAILPYRGKTRLRGSWLQENFRVGTREQAQEFVGHYARSGGTYKLVYKSPQCGSVSIDPRTGGVAR